MDPYYQNLFYTVDQQGSRQSTIDFIRLTGYPACRRLVERAPTVNVLIACEYSARVRDAFRSVGHNAWSVDVLPTRGDPRWHFQDDALKVAREYAWDMLIAFPPCTHLANIGASSWPVKQNDGRQQQAIDFVIDLYYSRIPMVAIENPVGRLSTAWRKPDQIIHPWQYGHRWQKRTCLWLKGLPLLTPTEIVTPRGHWVAGQAHSDEYGVRRYIPVNERRWNGDRVGHASDKPLERAKTFTGIAQAMARQWG